MKTPLQVEMYYVTEYNSTCIFLEIINSAIAGLVDFFL